MVQEYGYIFEHWKNMGQCNMGPFLKIRKYGSKQYGSISEKLKIWVETIYVVFVHRDQLKGKSLKKVQCHGAGT